MEISSSYYENGSILGKFRGINLDKINKLLNNLFINKEIKEGFFFESKYKNSSDLRPNVIDYDECFLDVLFESKVNELLFKNIGSDYVLSHIQVRRLDSGNTYLDWHRDSYNYGTRVGDYPPAHKIIYHPLLDGISDESKLVVSRASHLRVYNSKFYDFFHNILSLNKFKTDKYYPSNENFMLFNGAAFHKVCSDKKPSICLIYSFLRKNQIISNPKRFTELNHRTVFKYEEKLFDK